MNKALSIALHRISGLFVTGLFQNIQEQMKALVFVFVLVDEQAINVWPPTGYTVNMGLHEIFLAPLSTSLFKFQAG